MAISKTQIRESHYKLSIDKSDDQLNKKINNQRFYLLIKRSMDIFGALIGLIILAPVFLIIALFIKLDDPKGKVFFRQVRIGKNGKTFYIYKFRSMVSNAEQLLDQLLDKNETTGAMFKIKKDPRVTRIGRFIRKTSLDELPQLINVFKGDMSLVGPRPPLSREVEEYTHYDMQRLLVKPGCTGLWQVSGRSNIGFKKMVELDIKYISKRSTFLDLKILMKTFIVLLRGAY